MALPLPNKETRVLSGHDGPVLVAKWNSDGTYCMTAGQDRTARLWNPHRPDEDTGALLIRTYRGPHGHAVQDLAISHDNARFASCGGDKTVYLWDVAASRVVRRFNGHLQRINSVCFNSESTVLVSGSFDGTVRIWDCKSHNSAPIQVLSDFKDSVSSCILTDHELIASCIDGCVRTYDLRAGKLHTDKLPDAVTSLTLSNDGNCLLASSITKGGSVKLLEKSSGELLNTFTGHTNSAYHVNTCFSRTDAYVISGSEDGTIFFWDLVEADVAHRLLGHRRAVCSVAYHPKLDMLLSASFDGSVRLWEKVATSA